MVQVLGVLHIVDNLQKHIDFFTTVLEFSLINTSNGFVTLKLGDEHFYLKQGETNVYVEKSNDLGFQHIAIVVSDIQEAYDKLLQNNVEIISTSPQTIPQWNESAAGIQACYFRGPGGHILELIAYPPDKGNPKWQDKTRLFLGIDHTAVVVSDTDTSVQFYTQFGMRVVGGSVNYGKEQEQLSGIPGAKVKITTLASNGVKIELLEYLYPPEKSRSNEDFNIVTVLSNTKNAIDSNYREIVHPDGHRLWLLD